MPFVEGETIGPYTLIEQLGQGGMATVYKAYHATLDRYVAIKVLHLAFLEDKTFLARFQREAKAVAKLEHPNIVPIYDFAEHEGRPYLVMKYIEGETLKARLKRGSISTEETLNIVRAIGGALDYAHRQGVLHRDVKPSNVLLANDGNIYLADYGLARIAQSTDASLTTDQVIGTPQYMSPEQATGSDGLDGRTDIYSFGVMLYEMVTGRVPFNADTPFAIIHDHIYTPLPLPRSVNPNVSEAVERVLLKALAKNMNDRFGTMAEFVTAYEQAVTVGKSTSTQIPAGMLTENENEAETRVQKRQHTKQAGGKKKRRWGIIIPVGLAAMFLCFIGLVIVGKIINGSGQRASNDLGQAISGMVEPTQSQATLSPFQETVAVLQQIKKDSDLADEMLDESIAAWKRADMAAARVAIIKMYFASGGDPQFFQDAFQTMQNEGAWTLIAEALFMGERTSTTPMPESTRLYAHEVLYRAAEDPLSTALFAANGNNPLFQIAILRQKMYRGNIGLVKEALGTFMEQPDKLKEFPEAHLLEAEVFLNLGDRDRALTILDTIDNDDNMPDWVWDMAYELQLDKFQ